MISYVLLITIVIGLAIGVYAWLKILANISPATDCKEGTSLILQEQNCYQGGLELILKNNGRFNIDGVIVAISNESQKQPVIYLMPDEMGGVLEGHYYLNEPVKPGGISYALFTNKEKSGDTIKEVIKIQLQPFIVDKNQRVICKNAVITQEVSDCQINELP